MVKCLAGNTAAFGPFHTQRDQAEAISHYFIRNQGNRKQAVSEELVLHLQLECQRELEETQTCGVRLHLNLHTLRFYKLCKIRRVTNHYVLEIIRQCFQKCIAHVYVFWTNIAHNLRLGSL